MKIIITIITVMIISEMRNQIRNTTTSTYENWRVPLQRVAIRKRWRYYPSTVNSANISLTYAWTTSCEVIYYQHVKRYYPRDIWKPPLQSIMSIKTWVVIYGLNFSLNQIICIRYLNLTSAFPLMKD